uniref:Uncharacterized protein n=1 Tax=viral metagenome TaxID=1070528 RepID=A0A6C0DFR7_9ZZZZ
MDASKITELRQKRANVFINRAQTVDSSTLTWNNMIQASKYVATQNPVKNFAGCTTCGGMSQVATGTAGVTPGAIMMPGQTVLYPNPPPLKPNPLFNNKGSGSFVYSSESITLQRAGQATCGVATVNQQQYITLPRCFCSTDIFYQNGNPATLYVPEGADVSGNWLNPYLPIPQPYLVTPMYSSGPLPNGMPSNTPCSTCSLFKVKLNGSGQWGYSPSYVPPNIGVVAVKDGSGNIVYVKDCTSCRPRATDVSQLV